MGDLADFLMRNKLDALGEKPEYSTADVNALMPQQPLWSSPLAFLGSATQRERSQWAADHPNLANFALQAVTMAPMALRSGAAPIRLYHGTRSSSPKFEPYSDYEVGPHFGTREQALSRLEHAGKDADGASVIPVDLYARNPLTIRDPGMFDSFNLPWALSRTGRFSKEDIARLNAHEEKRAGILESGAPDAQRQATAAFYADLRDVLSGKGYDALRYRNTSEHPEINALMHELRGPPKAGRDRDAIDSEIRAIKQRLSAEGDYSYVPLHQGSVYSGLTGNLLYGLAPAIAAPSLAAILQDQQQQ